MKKIMIVLRKLMLYILPEVNKWIEHSGYYSHYESNLKIGKNVSIAKPSHITNCVLNDYCAIGHNVHLDNVIVGKFSSISLGTFAGWGTHPIDGLSTYPMFYSTTHALSLSKEDKVFERKQIIIGNDVYIGSNVFIMDGVIIGDGAIISAGSIVNRNIPPYAVAIGNPLKIKTFRYDDVTIKKLLKIKWWDFADEDLQLVEKYFYDVSVFIEKVEDKMKN